MKKHGTIIASFVIFFNILILLNPAEMIGAASDGLKLWLNVVFPSLFPFIVGVNLLTELGAVEALGRVLDPITRRLFRIPGAGGFALVSGMISGYPMGVKVTARLRERGELTRRQAERLLGFVNNCGPLFVVGAVGAGMFKNAGVGYFILGVHYFSAVLTGVMLSFFAGRDGGLGRRPGVEARPCIAGENAAHETAALSPAPPKSRPFGEILGVGVQDAMASILKVGGVIIIFSVLVKSAEMLNLSGPARGVVSGLLEMTNGIGTMTGGDMGMRFKVAAAAGTVSFGGLSVHAQSAAFLQGLDLRAKWYYIGKSVQTALSVVLAAAFYPLLSAGQCAGAKTDAAKAEAFARFFTGGGFLHNSLASLTCFAGLGLVILIALLLKGDLRGVVRNGGNARTKRRM